MKWIQPPFFKPAPAVEKADPDPDPSPPPPPPLPTIAEPPTVIGAGTGPRNNPDSESDDARSLSPPRPSSSPLHRPADTDAELGVAATGGIAVSTRLLQPTTKFTAHQIFYIFILDGLGAMVVSGGINFGIAYAMYTSPTSLSQPITLWAFPSTLAGDAAVTIILQCLVTWFIELFLVNRDLASGGVAPVGFIPQPTTSSWARWFFFLDSRQSQKEHARKPGQWVGFILSQATRAMILAFVSFCLFWGPTVGLLMLAGEKRGNDWVYGHTWVPQLCKMILGGVLGLLGTPGMVLFWLCRAGWEGVGDEGVEGEK
ncbi:hypothetical protein QBC35DRAFT_464037 [Podospora australis]|uniref:Uncharacterized protein n=1 Tax=Podospora australis TaxID=1536484 RepID=A0AAN6WSD6_9PEZI|nr:hypothetical protein QBC35DRAFT_464037 [Podospora australis]